MNSTAWRLPSVIVPVLSSRSTSTSPAASTARPDSAITLRLIMRSMPAMPIALRRPPIVVGIRHTSRATSTVIVTGVPWPATPTLNTEYGYSVAQTSRNRIVKPTSRMFSAISFGVFCRRAPSISAIMRSMKPSPGLAVMRISSQSDSTTVLPVTALRSPPDSRITGALSPVTALSSTDATPSITSPSAGIASPAWTSTTSPFRSAVDGTVSDGALRSGRTSRRAEIVRRARRSASACALPRPSASASAKFAKTHGEPQPDRHAADERRGRLALPAERLEEQDRREHAADLHDEHHRVAELLARIQPQERIPDRHRQIIGLLGCRAVRRCLRSCCLLSPHLKVVPAISSRCSTIGPSASTGRKLSAPSR